MAMIVGTMCPPLKSAEKMPESPLIAGHRRQRLIGESNGAESNVIFGPKGQVVTVR